MGTAARRCSGLSAAAIWCSLLLWAPLGSGFDVDGWWAGQLSWRHSRPPQFGRPMLSEFDLNHSYTNLNQGSYGSTPTKVRLATQALVQLVERNPDGWFRPGLVEDGADAPFTQFLTSTRRLLARYIGAQTEDVVLVDNASHGLTAVLRSVPAFMAAAGRPGVLFLDLAYYQVKITAQFVADKLPPAGHPLTEVDTQPTGWELNEDKLVRAVRTGLARANNTVGLCSFSHIASIPGVILPVARLAAECKAAGALVLVDGAHVPGNLPLRVESLGADFYVGNGHKHLFTSRGVALLWARREHQALVAPLVIDHGGTGSLFEQSFAYQGTTDDVTRYISLRAALEFREWIGEEAIVSYNTKLASDGCSLLAKAWGTRRFEDSVQANLCNVEMPCNASSPACNAVQLFRRYGFYCPIYTRAGSGNSWMRLTAQIYNTIQDFELVRDAVIEQLQPNEPAIAQPASQLHQPNDAPPAPVVLRPVGAGQSVDPYLFGYCAEAFIGITLNKLLNDTAGVAAARGLNAQVLRYPGGTLSNIWDPIIGHYVEPSPFAADYPSGYDKWQAILPSSLSPNGGQVWAKQLNKKYPPGTFSAAQYLQPGNLGAVPKRTLWDLNVYTFNASAACAQIEYIGRLPGQQAPGVILELGNELYIRNQGLPRFPNSSIYAESMRQIVACARRFMPHAKIAAVGAPGQWNRGLRPYADMFDAISWHAYQPHGFELDNLTRLEDKVSFISGYGRAVTQQAVAQLSEEVGRSLPLVLSEFGYGLDPPGQCVLDKLLNGALHGVFHVSRILEGTLPGRPGASVGAAINSPGSFAAITLESFVGGSPAAGPNVPVDPQAGNRTDYWCGLAAATVPSAHSNRPDLVRIAGTGQLFSHFAATAFRSDRTRMLPVAVEGGPHLPFAILGQPLQPCLQAAAFASATGEVSLSMSVLNICNQSIHATLHAAPNATARATLYSLLDAGEPDPGPLHQRGWARLPEDPSSYPWPSGPLHPTTAGYTANSAGEVGMQVPGLTFAIFDISSS